MADYAWRPGRRYKSDPDKAAKVFEKLDKKQGLTPERVLAAAQSKLSPIHEDFEWSDGKAGHQYRLIQARTMIRSVVRVVGDQPEPVFVHTHTVDAGSFYTDAVKVVSDEEMLENAIEEARSFMRSGRNRFAHLRRVSEAFSHAEKAFDEALDG